MGLKHSKIANEAKGLDWVFTFGQGKGYTIAEMIDDQRADYVLWCTENIEDFQLDNEAFIYLNKKLRW